MSNSERITYPEIPERRAMQNATKYWVIRVFLACTIVTGGIVYGSRSQRSDETDSWLLFAKDSVISPDIQHIAAIVKVIDESGLDQQDLQLMDNNGEVKSMFLTDGTIINVLWSDPNRLEFNEAFSVFSNTEGDEISEHGGVKLRPPIQVTQTKIADLTTGQISSKP